eukprot:1942214-Rhodomonas_salina.1
MGAGLVPGVQEMESNFGPWCSESRRLLRSARSLFPETAHPGHGIAGCAHCENKDQSLHSRDLNPPCRSSPSARKAFLFVPGSVEGSGFRIQVQEYGFRDNKGQEFGLGVHD